MKNRLMRLLFLAAVGVVCGGASLTEVRAQSRVQQPEVLTNVSVMKLVRAGFREKTVVAIINSRPTRFDLSPERLIELKKGGVSERVILAMLNVGEGVLVEGLGDGDWDDDVDSIFGRRASKGGDSGSGNGTGNIGGDPGSTNIFGSSGGSRGRTRSRSGSGGSEGETETVGSATVRILRPPAEAGGAPPKLERTPTLTNDSVMELVEAGFTEGTIIRRIEGSPAEYDLRAEKLADLKRRRVSEAIISAMRRAMMGDDGAESPSTVKP
jgi:hypothetical protein